VPPASALTLLAAESQPVDGLLGVAVLQVLEIGIRILHVGICPAGKSLTVCAAARRLSGQGRRNFLVRASDSALHWLGRFTPVFGGSALRFEGLFAATHGRARNAFTSPHGEGISWLKASVWLRRELVEACLAAELFAGIRPDPRGIKKALGKPDTRPSMARAVAVQAARHLF